MLETASTPSIIGVEYSSLYAGEWGKLLVKVRGAGLVSLAVEGDVEWLDPGRVMLSGESVVEVPVKPGVVGEFPVRVVVKSESGEDARIAWLRASEKARKCPNCGAPAEPGANYCWKCGARIA
uniref:Zinc ribbon domain-containing protein n=1 Tax=Thermofilum pendens TaxID=2269 RepID=A0A7J3X7K4_THEPE